MGYQKSGVSGDFGIRIQIISGKSTPRYTSLGLFTLPKIQGHANSENQSHDRAMGFQASQALNVPVDAGLLVVISIQRASCIIKCKCNDVTFLFQNIIQFQEIRGGNALFANM